MASGCVRIRDTRHGVPDSRGNYEDIIKVPVSKDQSIKFYTTNHYGFHTDYMGHMNFLISPRYPNLVLTMSKGSFLPANSHVLEDTADLVQLSFFNEPSEYEKDGIDWKNVHFEDNQECLNLIEQPHLSSRKPAPDPLCAWAGLDMNLKKKPA
ncbi:hypothetical protein Sjap_020795 [Stephania japonica]|uniref:Uncharacterized protein n=1 Tax=Stephania japonica TaxID=461633 RepID=A0AAP0F2K5_9MAGN